MSCSEIHYLKIFTRKKNSIEPIIKNQHASTHSSTHPTKLLAARLAWLLARCLACDLTRKIAPCAVGFTVPYFQRHTTRNSAFCLVQF